MKRVLIVDDHPVVRLAVRMLMERHGLEVVAETDNGTDALKLALEYVPDILILDIGILEKRAISFNPEDRRE